MATGKVIIVSHTCAASVSALALSEVVQQVTEETFTCSGQTVTSKEQPDNLFLRVTLLFRKSLKAILFESGFPSIYVFLKGRSM